MEFIAGVSADELKKKLAQLVKEREGCIINLHRVNGAVAALEMLLQKLEQAEKKENSTNG